MFIHPLHETYFLFTEQQQNNNILLYQIKIVFQKKKRMVHQIALDKFIFQK